MVLEEPMAHMVSLELVWSEPEELAVQMARTVLLVPV
jgi:hypothetical protein